MCVKRLEVSHRMALKGEGDPRWIVTNRDDGRNVNNWHWYVSLFVFFRMKWNGFIEAKWNNVEYIVE